MTLAGSAIITVSAGILALYFASTFEVSTLMRWLQPAFGAVSQHALRWKESHDEKRQAAIQKAKALAAERAARRHGERS